MSVDPSEVGVALSKIGRKDISKQTQELEEAAQQSKRQAEIVAALASSQVMENFKQVFLNGPNAALDVNAWIRIGEILLGRSIPKVAARHAQESGGDVDSIDVVALREEIEKLHEKKGR